MMWCVWKERKERNSRCFEDNECSMPDRQCGETNIFFNFGFT